MTEGNEQKVYDALKALEIKYIRYEHEPLYTVEDTKKLDINITGQHCKNLFLRNSKGNVHYLVLLDDAKKVNLKDLAKQIESTKLSFASEERLHKYLGLRPGSVTPFGIINDIESEVIVLIDKDITKADVVNFHPNVNTATIGLSYSDLEKFIKWHGNKIYYVDISI
ncbi:prolyl-tRNA synthetase associated domain-containing protein [Clostridium saccharoperbutylacetonicum]|uniref:prolyl-tRNA synthetase associated domain-containing protein n=1 Tax=Clostridium saccharoperbutylacetonicum TaxID=36745 RepID=UPI0009840175|nr:prolyl-tRNA synthetase associated domain-containing protein [Clostridium saccharoperbutylacetonicum]AQR94345.1 prolyl-tRNA editing protein ProX [Clostridium saccharoperbutylacetonicum]NSB30044.1 Ala-tRNA(Pro) deacylase [Clostridium saccharoperbutylacetonicum]